MWRKSWLKIKSPTLRSLLSHLQPINLNNNWVQSKIFFCPNIQNTQNRNHHSSSNWDSRSPKPKMTCLAGQIMSFRVFQLTQNKTASSSGKLHITITQPKNHEKTPVSITSRTRRTIRLSRSNAFVLAQNSLLVQSRKIGKRKQVLMTLSRLQWNLGQRRSRLTAMGRAWSSIEIRHCWWALSRALTCLAITARLVRTHSIRLKLWAILSEEEIQ